MNNALLLLLAGTALILPARAVQTPSGSFQNTTSSTPDADYVGSLNGASGVYLGNGFVLTAAHVGSGDFILDGQTYDQIAGSAMEIGTADLTLFRIADAPSLPALTLATDPPTAFSAATDGSSVEIIGYGLGHGETYGNDTVTEVSQPTAVPVGSTTYESVDFYTDNGTIERGRRSITNDYELVSGDSGGGDFITNPSTGTLELAGINEAELIDSDTGDEVGSAYVQLSDYSTIIAADELTETPEPSAWLLCGVGLLALTGCSRLRLAQRT